MGKKGADLRVQAPSKAEKFVLLGVRGALCRQRLVVTSGHKRSADFLALLDEVEQVFQLLTGDQPVIKALDHDTSNVSGINRQG